MPETRGQEIEQLKAQIAELTELVRGGGNMFHVPDPIKQLSEFSGNKKELIIWLDEVDQLYNSFKVKGINGAPDTMNAYYVQAIKNKIRGEARITLCANGNPSTIPEIKKVLMQHYGDQRDIATNLNLLFNTKKGDRSHQKFFNDVKELEMRIRSNLQLNPLSSVQLLQKIVITKYLDNITEPLASIIRSTNPANIEEAFQAVTLNQNAEIRKPFAKPNSHSFKNNSNNNPSTSGPRQNAGPSHQKNHNYKPTTDRKPSTYHKIKTETNATEANEIDDVVSDTGEDEFEEEVSSEEYDELNFQTARLMKNLT